tara:strand:- start:298 stop:732 length:435 start_codon:yes stop_codon:yes gene_type:complete
MSEKNFWTLIRNNLPLKMYRVENKVMKGMPDVHYIDTQGNSGWIELKFLESWPKKVLSIGLRMNQSLWLTSYARNKGNCWVLLKVGRDYTALIKGEEADKLFRPSRKEFFGCVLWSKKGNLSKDDWAELCGVITLSPKMPTQSV